MKKMEMTQDTKELCHWVRSHTGSMDKHPEACEVRQYIRKPHLGKDTKAKRHRHDMGCHGLKLAGGT